MAVAPQCLLELPNITHCFQLTAYCRLPTADCLLRTAYCLLPTALLLSALAARGGFRHIPVKVAGGVGVFELDGGMRDAELAG